MTDRRIKTPDEWEKIIGKLSPDTFEHLCCQLVKCMPGFVNVDLRSGSYDAGRDIDAVYRGQAPDGITEISEKWRFECKKYSKGISYDNISRNIQRASQNRIDKFVIMSNMHLTTACKDEIEKTKNNLYCKIIDWTGIHFQDILFLYPHICKEFFSDEEIPQRTLDIKQSKELIKDTQRASSHFGLKIEVKLKEGQKPPQNIDEATDIVKDILLNLKNIDLNIKSLIYQQVSGFFFRINRKEDALLFIDQSLQITPNNVAALLTKGFILEKMDDIDNSTKCYDKILEMEKKNKFALNNKAHNLRRKGEFDNALDLVNKTLKIDPNFSIAINNKTTILKDFGKTEEALEFLEPKLKNNPNSILLLESKTILLTDLLDLLEAMKTNEKILEIDPNNIIAINNKGVIYEHNARYQKPGKYMPLAVEWFEKAISKDEDFPLAWANKLVCLINGGFLTDAESILDTVTGIFPTNSYILDEKGRLFLENNEPKKALKCFNKALKYDFRDKMIIHKAEALFELHQYDKVMKIIDDLLRINKKSSGAWSLKGKALEKLHQLHMAKRCFRNAKKHKKIPKSLLENI